MRVDRLIAAALLGGGLIAVLATRAAADPPPPPGYLESVERAYALIENASGTNTTPAERAHRVLLEGTEGTQPEILADLKARPPLYDDARVRLRALIAALQDPVDTSNPEGARQRLQEVMSMKRFDALHRPPSIVDRIGQWIQDRISDFLQLLFGRRGGAQPPEWWLYLIGIAIVAAVVFVVFRAARGRFTQSIATEPQGPRPASDYFAEADALAGRGDRVGAIRALCAGVAATLEGERSWEGSPLTVREIFSRSPDFAALRQLLLPFEAAVYGGRDIDAATYARAAQVAAPYRRPVQAAA
ncbi:MAG TPA: hypothetical protein VJR46_13335 [Candidatus Dormibacteraeota bacterium]|nr:hypothetical protein [Candidatus Dormibacteraeota bacterium]